MNERCSEDACSLAAYLETLKAAGYKDIALRCFPADSEWQGIKMRADWWYCRAWQPGTVNVKNGAGFTPKDAVLNCIKDGPTPSNSNDIQNPWQTAFSFGQIAWGGVFKPFTDAEKSVVEKLR